MTQRQTGKQHIDDYDSLSMVRTELPLLLAQSLDHLRDMPNEGDSLELIVDGVPPCVFVYPCVVRHPRILDPSNVVGGIGTDRDVLSSDPEIFDLHMGCLGSVTWREGFAVLIVLMSRVFPGRGMQYIVVARWAGLSDTTGGSEPVRLKYQIESELAHCSPTYLAHSTKDVR